MAIFVQEEAMWEYHLEMKKKQLTRHCTWTVILLLFIVVSKIGR